MFRYLAAIAFLVTACTDDPPDCGDYPNAPAFVVAYEQVNGFERAVLTVPDYMNILVWREDVDRWSACMGR